MPRCVGVSSGVAGGVVHTEVDAFVQADDTVVLRLKRGKANHERLVLLHGDPDLMLDLAHQLLGAAQVVRERKAVRASRSGRRQ